MRFFFLFLFIPLLSCMETGDLLDGVSKAYTDLFVQGAGAGIREALDAEAAVADMCGTGPVNIEEYTPSPVLALPVPIVQWTEVIDVTTGETIAACTLLFSEYSFLDGVEDKAVMKLVLTFWDQNGRNLGRDSITTPSVMVARVSLAGDGAVSLEATLTVTDLLSCGSASGSVSGEAEFHGGDRITLLMKFGSSADQEDLVSSLPYSPTQVNTIFPEQGGMTSSATLEGIEFSMSSKDFSEMGMAGVVEGTLSFEGYTEPFTLDLTSVSYPWREE